MTPGWIERDAGDMIANVWVADTWGSRLRGLLGRAPLDPYASEGLLIRPCASVHTFGMRYPLDLVYLDRSGTVVGLRSHLAPWRVSACKRAHATVEFHAGALARLRPRLGECWHWRRAEKTSNGQATI